MSWVREINRLDDLADQAPIWSRLLAVTPGAGFFQSLAWLQVYWRHYAGGQRLRVLLVGRDDRTLGILPLVVHLEPTRVGMTRVLTYPLSEWGSFYGPIGPDPEETLTQGLQHIAHSPREWDLLDLRWVDDTTTAGATARALTAAGLSFHQQPWKQVGLVRFPEPGAWDPYWAERTSRFRNNVRRSERKLAAEGKVDYTWYRPSGAARGECDPRWDLYEKCEEVARRSWQGSANDGTTLSHPEIRDFLRDVHEAAVREGGLDLHLLQLDNRPAAFAYNYYYQGYVFGLRMGFDASVSREGAGTVLMHRALQSSCQAGDHTYDFGTNYVRCKRHWLTEIVDSQRYGHFPLSSPRAQLLRFKRLWCDWFDQPTAATADVK